MKGADVLLNQGSRCQLCDPSLLLVSPQGLEASQAGSIPSGAFQNSLLVKVNRRSMHNYVGKGSQVPKSVSRTEISDHCAGSSSLDESWLDSM